MPENADIAPTAEGITKPDPNDENGRHHRRGHVLELRECDWRCLICGHWFDAASDADLFWCGDDCAGKHHGDEKRNTPGKHDGEGGA